MMIPSSHLIFKALADPIRLRIAVMLTRGERCVCDIQKVLGLPQSTVSRHLGQMRMAGLVRDRRAGKWVHYRLAESESQPAAAVLKVLVEMAALPSHAEDIRLLEAHAAAKECRE